MIPGIIRKGLSELGGLEPKILNIERNGSDNGFVGCYDGDNFYFRIIDKNLILKLERDNPLVVKAFEEWQGYRFWRRNLKGKTTIYEWKMDD